MFMVRKMNHRFKNILTMDVIVGSLMVAGGCGTYDDKMRFSVIFNLKAVFKAYLSHCLCQKPSFPVDVMQPLCH